MVPQDGSVFAVVSAVVLVLVAAIGIFVAAVWLGMHVIAPRLRRALDRAETEDDQQP